MFLDRLAAILDALPLKSSQRLLHILFPDTRQWKFKKQEGFDVDHKIFGYFLWAKTQRSGQVPQNALVVAYQPPWILSQVDFEDFIKCGSVRCVILSRRRVLNFPASSAHTPGAFIS